MKYAMISLENKKIEMYLYYIPAYILTFFCGYVNKKISRQR